MRDVLVTNGAKTALTIVSVLVIMMAVMARSVGWTKSAAVVFSPPFTFKPENPVVVVEVVDAEALTNPSDNMVVCKAVVFGVEGGLVFDITVFPVSSVSSSVKAPSSVTSGRADEVCAVSRAGSSWIVSTAVVSGNCWVDSDVSSSIDVSSSTFMGKEVVVWAVTSVGSIWMVTISVTVVWASVEPDVARAVCWVKGAVVSASSVSSGVDVSASIVTGMVGVKGAIADAGSSWMVSITVVSAAADDGVLSVSSSVKAPSSVVRGRADEVCTVSRAGSSWIVSTAVVSGNVSSVSSSVDISSSVFMGKEVVVWAVTSVGSIWMVTIAITVVSASVEPDFTRAVCWVKAAVVSAFFSASSVS